MSLFHFLQQISPFATDCARRPCRAGWLKKNHPRFAPVFFFRQALHRSLAKNSRASKKLKYWLHGAGHV